MIKSNYTTALAAGLVSVLSIGAVLPSGAQHGPRDYQRTALTAIKEGKWQEALDAVDRCIRVYEPRIKMLGLDDGFGWFYYQKGVCLAQLKNYKEAVEAFKACYTKFPSAKNQLVKMALFREGENYCRCQGRGAAGKIPERIPQRSCRQKRQCRRSAGASGPMLFQDVPACF